MTDDQPSASMGAVPAPPSATASGPLPYPLWMLFGLGVVVCVAWLGAVLLDLWGAPATHLLPSPLRGGLRVVLVLAVPALILLVVRSPRQPARRHARAFFFVEALVVLIVALPSLLPYSTPADLVSLPLRVPTLSLGVVLAAVDPLVSERWRTSRARDSRAAVVASAGFGAVVLAAAIFLQLTSMPQCPRYPLPGGGLTCAGFASVAVLALWGETLACVIAGWLGARLGYALGARIARSEHWQ
ncbi:MAG TPA: hypothetical protein VGS80_25745 [Ktedonobacterales bacterium]|nr:hypothetical protein [Ktedonobacterales bacterium]